MDKNVSTYKSKFTSKYGTLSTHLCAGIPEASKVMRATQRVWQLQFTESRYVKNCAVKILKNVH